MQGTGRTDEAKKQEPQGECLVWRKRRGSQLTRMAGVLQTPFLCERFQSVLYQTLFCQLRMS